ncbi:hypothetical protein PSTT_15459 [Puccinia striiformis]|uniref:Major facilitator superfamily (MFS) profile domain-containing protein n=1 Tax=Puccinia striiformis TaxID=27350 RepID=A0A2S4UHG4_9BASI|nr:hypothetical protein PSTT_15459 [Puccinia striiformis]
MPLRMADSDSDHRQPPTPGRNNRAKLQLLILCLIRLCEPISFTVIFPMVAFMVAEFNPTHSDKQVGFYCGAIESIFSLAQFSTIILWGKLSDRIGRKPVLLIGLIGVSISTLAFGFSSSFWTMILARSIGGVLNAENQALAFSLLPTSFAVGSAIGPLLVAAIAPLLEFVMATLWLNETLPNKKSTNTEREPLLQSLADIDVQESLVPPGPSPTKILDLLKDRNLLVILISYSLLSFQHISLEALIVLFASTPIKSGGIGFSSADIGLALSLSGVMVIFVQLGLFPFFQKRFGTARLYKSSYSLLFTSSLEVKTRINKRVDQVSQEYHSQHGILDVLATINGMAQSCGSFVRAIGPITASSLFAFSVLHQNFIDGNSVFLLFACIALGAFLNSLNIKDGLEQWRNT